MGVTLEGLQEHAKNARHRYTRLANEFERTGSKQDRRAALVAFWVWLHLASAITKFKKLNDNETNAGRKV